MKKNSYRKAKLIKNITDDGLVETLNGINIGREYLVDLDTKVIAEGFNTVEGVKWEREIINTVDACGMPQWYPTELLEIEE